ncbi:hypothetical protein ACT3TD_13730 [Corynebacterium sp. AOP36-E1-14]|uniref:hypothetical protein n=1 Tax=Corynebacterium sp. AOP36-E1-14 TaxID=3457682 RepID=UPI004034A25F
MHLPVAFKSNQPDEVPVRGMIKDDYLTLHQEDQTMTIGPKALEALGSIIGMWQDNNSRDNEGAAA